MTNRLPRDWSLPVGVTALSDMPVHFLEVPTRVHALRQWLSAEHSVDLGLVIVDSNVSAGSMRTLATIADSANCSVLVVSSESSASLYERTVARLNEDEREAYFR